MSGYRPTEIGERSDEALQALGDLLCQIARRHDLDGFLHVQLAGPSLPTYLLSVATVDEAGRILGALRHVRGAS